LYIFDTASARFVYSPFGEASYTYGVGVIGCNEEPKFNIVFLIEFASSISPSSKCYERTSSLFASIITFGVLGRNIFSTNLEPKSLDFFMCYNLY